MSCFYCLLLGYKKEKQKNQIRLLLEKDGITRTETLNTSKKLGMIKLAKKLNQLNREGWNLIDAEGESSLTPFIKNIAQGHKPTAKEMLNKAGLPGMPNVLKKHFKKSQN